MNFDILMPTILLVVTLTAMFLSKKAEPKLKATVQERQLKTRDTLLMVILIVVAVSIVVFIPSMAILALFLFSYSSLLFTVSYAFSDMKNNRIIAFCAVFAIASAIAGAAGLIGVIPSDLRFVGVLSFIALTGATVFVLMLAARQPAQKQKWYLAVLPPALFLLLFAFFSRTFVWFPFLLDVFGITFALLIVVYMSSLFSWKSALIFAAFITGLDIYLVWVTGQMVEAANAVSGLGLPVLVAFPTIPPMFGEAGLLLLNLGLGDFFFAGILAVQTRKKFNLKTALASLVTICVSFGLFELILLNRELYEALPVKALPATLPILLGWLPVALVALFVQRKRAKREKPESSETAQEPQIEQAPEMPKVP